MNTAMKLIIIIAIVFVFTLSLIAADKKFSTNDVVYSTKMETIETLNEYAILKRIVLENEGVIGYCVEFKTANGHISYSCFR